MDNLTGAELIAAERKRQIEVLNYDIRSDEDYSDNQLVFAALAYLTPIEDDDEYWVDEFDTIASKAEKMSHPPLKTNHRWPWSHESFKRSPDSCGYSVAIRDLVKAGALIAAEIDRLSVITWENYGPVIESHDSESVTREATGLRADGKKFTATAIYQHDEFIELQDIEEAD